MKKILKATFYLGLFGLLLIAMCDTIVEESSQGNVYTDVQVIPAKQTALVLGTSQKTRNGHMNPYFSNRIKAAVELYKAGKVKYIIVSGDNGRSNYDESTDMKNLLIDLGVPEDVIYLDFAGFRTLDSIVRCDKIFDQQDVIIVSQKFHNERAIFIGRAKGVRAVGYNAKDVSIRYGFPVHVREKLARVKAVIDIVTRKKPKFLGPKVEIAHA
ncbi:MAG: SanA protein [Bacteroidia bacterium]|jgi:SanA protein